MAFDFPTFWAHVLAGHGKPAQSDALKILDEHSTSPFQAFVTLLRYYEKPRGPAPDERTLIQKFSLISDANHLKYKAALDYAKIELKFSPPPRRPPPKPAVQAAGPRAMARPRPPASPPQAWQTNVANREARLQATEVRIVKDLTQILDGVKYEWKVDFKLFLSLSGTQYPSIIVKVPIHAKSGVMAVNIPAGHEGAALTDAIRQNWRKTIQERWNGGALKHNKKIYSIDFHIEWVAASESPYTVYCIKDNSGGDGTVDTGFWGAQDGVAGKTGAIAHEFGHLIGNPDEYGAVDFKGWSVTDWGSSIMRHEHGLPASSNLYLIAYQAAKHLLKVNPSECTVSFPWWPPFDVGKNHPYLGFRK